MRMRIPEIWTSMILVQTSAFLLVGSQDTGAFPGQRSGSSKEHRYLRPGRELGYSGKRASAATEPTCEELRAMWRYSKRQSRAAESTNELPVYRDPFSYNLWEAHNNRPSSPGYRDEYTGPARSRGAGGPPIYGKLVHKAPVGSRWRNGMPDRTRAFEEVTRFYGTINRHPPSQRRRITNFRVGGGGGASRLPVDDVDEGDTLDSSLSQTGSFQHLKELILTERARELQEQRRIEEMAARGAVLKEMTSGDRLQSRSRTLEPRNTNFLTSMKRYRDPKNYELVQAQYVADISDIGQAFSKTDHSGHEFMIR